MRKYILLLIIALTVVGCDDYLDVTPKDKQTAAQLYSTKAGFYTAANGIYDGLASDALYGKNMTWEALGLMSKHYVTTKSTQRIKDLAAGSLTSAYAAPVLDEIWQKAYQLIMAANILINNIENQEGLLTAHEATILKGEMLAVRAFLHLDMLRLFGPRVETDPEAKAIPYNESAEVTVLPLLSCNKVMEKIHRDLNESEELLAEDPIIENGPMMSDVEAESVQLRYRQFRFNYYTVIALKARACLWEGDKENALINAKRLLEDPVANQHFPSVDPNQLLANNVNPDRVFSSEILTAVYVKNRGNIYSNYFSTSAPASQFLQPYSTFVVGGRYGIFTHLLLGSETTDYRYQSQWEAASGTGSSGHSFIKYKAIARPDDTDEDSEYYYSRMISLVRMAEMYYIAYECESDVTNRLNWYNQIRQKRGCPPFPAAYAAYLDMTAGYGGVFLSQEYLREFYGEGQAFFFMKRVETYPGYGYGIVSPLDNGEAMSAANVPTPTLPEGEMK